MRHEDTLRDALAGGQRPLSFAGTWTNAHGSHVQLRQAPPGKLSGSFFSVSGDGSAIGELQGYVDGDLIAFVVQWHSYRAISVWAGHLEPDAAPPRIVGSWQMAKQLADPGAGLTIQGGSDSFTRTSDSTPGLARREPV